MFHQRHKVPSPLITSIKKEEKNAIEAEENIEFLCSSFFSRFSGLEQKIKVKIKLPANAFLLGDVSSIHIHVTKAEILGSRYIKMLREL
jgi:hypothetical protein